MFLKACLKRIVIKTRTYVDPRNQLWTFSFSRQNNLKNRLNASKMDFKTCLHCSLRRTAANFTRSPPQLVMTRPKDPCWVTAVNCGGMLVMSWTAEYCRQISQSADSWLLSIAILEPIRCADCGKDMEILLTFSKSFSDKLTF